MSILMLESSTPSINLRVVSKNATTVTIAWNVVPGADGYLFFHNGVRVARTLNPNMTSTKFSYASGDTLGVEAIILTTIASAKIKV